MELICVFFGLLFTTAGLLFALGKLHHRLPSWQRMNEEDRKAIRIVPLCRNVGGMIALCGLIFLARGLIPAFTGRWFVGAMIAWLILAGLDVRHISKSDRYRNR